MSKEPQQSRFGNVGASINPRSSNDHTTAIEIDTDMSEPEHVSAASVTNMRLGQPNLDGDSSERSSE